MQIGVPAAGYVLAWAKGDREGAWQLTKVLVSTTISAHTFKYLGERGRPDASDKRSFPSGHTSAAFSGSEYIRVRYGNAYGIPATVAAAFVGYSRIRANKHFRDDVLAGMSNGLLWNWFWTTPYEQKIGIKPGKMGDGVGVHVTYDPDAPDSQNQDYTSRPKMTYTLEYGPVTQDKHLFINPIATGFPIDLATAEDEFDITSRVTFTHFFRDRHEWSVHLAPMELIEFDPSKVLTEPAEFGGTTFVPQPDTSFESRYNMIDSRFLYRYRLVDTPSWEIRVGGGLQYVETSLDVTQFRGVPKDNDMFEYARVLVQHFTPMASLRATYAFNERWRLMGSFDGYGGDDEFTSVGLVLNWRAAPGWDLGIGARYISREMSASDTYNKLEAGDFVFNVTHGFF
mgnify:CR=1 FL=1